MNAFYSVIRTVNALTGRNARRSRALRAVSEWADTVQKFLTDFNLYGTSNLGTLLDSTGNAKFDLVGIIYNGRQVARQARPFKSAGLPELVVLITNGAENMRRYLISPEYQSDRLKATIKDLRVDYEKLRAAINAIETGE